MRLVRILCVFWLACAARIALGAEPPARVFLLGVEAEDERIVARLTPLLGKRLEGRRVKLEGGQPDCRVPTEVCAEEVLARAQGGGQVLHVRIVSAKKGKGRDVEVWLYDPEKKTHRKWPEPCQSPCTLEQLADTVTVAFGYARVRMEQAPTPSPPPVVPAPPVVMPKPGVMPRPGAGPTPGDVVKPGATPSPQGSKVGAGHWVGAASMMALGGAALIIGGGMQDLVSNPPASCTVDGTPSNICAYHYLKGPALGLMVGGAAVFVGGVIWMGTSIHRSRRAR